MFEELEVVELTHDIKERRLKEGERGTIVEIYNDGEAYEVEFVTPNGRTIALLTLMPTDIRSTLNKVEYFSHGINPPVSTSTASGITSIVGAKNTLRGINKIISIYNLRTKTENIKDKEFRYPQVTV